MPQLTERIDAFLEATQARNPEVSVFLGGGVGVNRLPDPSPDGMEAKKDFVRVWKERFAALDRDTLDAEARLDVEVFTRSADLWLYNVEMLNAARHNPDPLEELSFLLFTQTRRETDDPEAQFRAIAGQLGEFGRYLKAFQARIEVADTRWTELALRVADTFPAFLETIRRRSARTVSEGLGRDLRNAIHRAHDALESHVIWLEQLRTRDDLWVLDEDRYATLLRLKGIEPGPEEIEEIGRTALAAFQAERDALARTIDPDGDSERVRRHLRQDHPLNFAEILGELRVLIQEARAFIGANAMATVHPWECLVTEPTPPFFRALIPSAAYLSPIRSDETQLGTYVITPLAEDMLLEDYCRSTLPLIAVHEGYPGHHHHIATVNRLSSILREGGTLGFPTDPAAWFGGELVEGWAYYAEARMLEHGFHDRPAVRFQFLDKLICRAARLLVDVRLSCGRMTFDEAVAYLQQTTGMPLAQAVPEVNRYTRNPAYQLGHLLGKVLLERLLEDRRAAEGDAFNLARFHDRVLQAGVLPVSLLSRHLDRVR